MDVISKYKSHRLLKNISIIITSLFLAISINYTLNNTNISNSIKSSVLNSNTSIEQKSDIYMEKENNTINNIISLKNSKNIYWLKNINMTIIYNPEWLEVSDIYLSNDNLKLTQINRENWIINLSINSQNELDLDKNQKIVNILFSKKSKKIEYLNLINSFFTDNNWNTFELSTSGIDF